MVALMSPVVDEEYLDRSKLEARVQAIYIRLTDGYRQIAEAEAAGQDVTHWETVWRKLLREYEETYNQLLALQ